MHSLHGVELELAYTYKRVNLAWIRSGPDMGWTCEPSSWSIEKITKKSMISCSSFSDPWQKNLNIPSPLWKFSKNTLGPWPRSKFAWGNERVIGSVNFSKLKIFTLPAQYQANLYRHSFCGGGCNMKCHPRRDLLASTGADGIMNDLLAKSAWHITCTYRT